MRALHGRNGSGWSTHLNVRFGLAAKDVEQELARRTAEPSPRFACLSDYLLIGSGPRNLEPATA